MREVIKPRANKAARSVARTLATYDAGATTSKMRIAALRDKLNNLAA